MLTPWSLCAYVYACVHHHYTHTYRKTHMYTYLCYHKLPFSPSSQYQSLLRVVLPLIREISRTCFLWKTVSLEQGRKTHIPVSLMPEANIEKAMHHMAVN